MRREIRFAASRLRGRPLWSLLFWSAPEALPAAVSGLAIARAVDTGFLAGRPWQGLAWLAVLVLASLPGALGSRQVFRCLGELVEPLRDDLVRRVVGGALGRAVAGEADDGAVARLTRQVEIVRDTYAGLVVVVRGFVVAVIGAVLGLLSTAPLVVPLILPPFLLGIVLFLAILGMAASRQRASVRADERLAAMAGTVLHGTRDVVASGSREHAARLVAGPIGDQATAERALASVAVLRTLCFAVGGWVPLVVLLLAGGWLVDRGVTAGALLGGLTYVLFGLQPALGRLMAGLGGSGLRFVVTLGRILDTSTTLPPAVPPPVPTRGHEVDLRGVTFAYGPHAEPVLRGLDLTLAEGDHLAVVGPSGIGKSTLAGLVCGLLPPGTGTVLVGGVPAGIRPDLRVLIPQEAYVFAGTTWDNVTYLRPAATLAQVDAAVRAVGAGPLVSRLGGLLGELRPDQLSAGERQLIALVRAYLSPAPLVVLDEATCHLDPAAEARAELAFAGRDGTLVVIAHRISSALRARRVLVLDGVRAELGEHEELARTSPLYRELLGHWRPEPPGAVPGVAGQPVAAPPADLAVMEHS